ncbi:MAG TPA: zinc-finger domain-containing protein [Coxiellaceae bacterium]|nr:zinc-finger domain-containing protein [Coxiellaceae bacterium]
MENEKQACSTKKQLITAQNLPLSCPLPDQTVWNAHPRVYLAIEESPEGEIECPYCSTWYVLEKV